MNLPETQQTVIPYLVVKNAPAFITFATNVFGAVETGRHLREDEKTIQHAQILVKECTIMISDASDQFGATDTHLFIYVDDADKVYEKALTEGGISLSSPSDQPYGRSCGIKDPFGTTWWMTTR